MKIVEKKILKMVKVVAKKQITDPPIPGCVTFYHQPKRPKK
ncbi:AgrD family cyclic lactone autoinducer peptide [Pseudobutyrivibrio sp.]|jgi:cyclic lactone autoinducer peptide|nr:cyclic lactone autoinducer peptide [Pseudobutyrivibrio sp.]